MPQNTLKALPLTTVDAATIGAGYTALNTPGFEHPVVYFSLINESSEPMFVSYDGVTDHDYADWDLIFFSQMAAVPNNNVAMMAKGTVIYGRFVVPATGYIYISAYYL